MNFIKIKYLVSISCLMIIPRIYSQGNISSKTLTETTMKACECIEKISLRNKKKVETNSEIKKCISEQVLAYSLSSKLEKIMDSVEDEISKKIDIEKNIDTIIFENEEIVLDSNENSDEFKKHYYEIENNLMENCQSLQDTVTKDDDRSPASVSNNHEAKKNFDLGIKEYNNNKFKKAIKYYKKALKIDSNFAFAWDNLGLAYRKIGDYDNAILSYEKSLELDPYGVTPLQNIAVVYSYKNENKKAINAYEKLGNIYKSDPEVYYGLGRIYSIKMLDHEKGLSNMCKAYNLYEEQSSPYRSDAEKMISIIFSEMKKEGKEDKFFEILKQNNITPELK